MWQRSPSRHCKRILTNPRVFPSGTTTRHDLHRLASITHVAPYPNMRSNAFRFRFISMGVRRGPFEDPGVPVKSDAQRKTVFALSTPAGKAGVAVVRVSGPEVLDVWRAMVRKHGKKAAGVDRPRPWKMEYCEVVHPQTGEVLDSGLAVYFRGGFRKVCCLRFLTGLIFFQHRGRSRPRMSLNCTSTPDALSFPQSSARLLHSRTAGLRRRGSLLDARTWVAGWT